MVKMAVEAPLLLIVPPLPLSVVTVMSLPSRSSAPPLIVVRPPEPSADPLPATSVPLWIVVPPP
jgi:hypothetical protein